MASGVSQLSRQARRESLATASASAVGSPPSSVTVVFIAPPAPKLVAVGGLSGTGKSVLARGLAPDVGPAPGAVLLRSDVERKTMLAVAKAMATDLSDLRPTRAEYFQANRKKFDASLAPWFAAIAAFKSQHKGVTVATTEPVVDYLLSAMGIKNLTPWQFQADIMNGVDPSPQDVTLENGLFTNHSVKAFVYNRQVIDSLTTSIRLGALKAGVPVVGVYETMPTPGYDYQSWMLAEVKAIEKAVEAGVSTEQL